MGAFPSTDITAFRFKNFQEIANVHQVIRGCKNGAVRRGPMSVFMPRVVSLTSAGAFTDPDKTPVTLQLEMSNRTRTTSILPRLGIRKMTCAEYATNQNLTTVPTPPPTPAILPEPHSSKPEPNEDTHASYTLPSQSNSTRHAGEEEQIASKGAENGDSHHPEPTISERLQLALYLENSGSVARDHLALERTFLAYMRTSLTFASTGVGA